MPHITADDGAEIFYKDWGAGDRRSSSATDGRSAPTPGRPRRCSWRSTATAPSLMTGADTAGPARPGTATRWTRTPTTWPA